MSFSISVSGKIISIDLSGSVDLSSTNALKEEFEQVMSSDITSVRINASGLNYIDSSGVASLLFMNKLCTRFNANFVFDQVSASAYRVITLANLDSVLGLPKSQTDSVEKRSSIPSLSTTNKFVAPEFSDADAMAIFQSNPPAPSVDRDQAGSFEIKPGSFS